MQNPYDEPSWKGKMGLELTQEKLGTLLRRWRTSKRLSGQEVAKAVGISQASLSRYENGLQQISLEKLDELVGVLEPDPHALAEAKEIWGENARFGESLFFADRQSGGVILSTQARLLMRERDANLKLVYADCIPAMLQTPEYVRQNMLDTYDEVEDVEKIVEIRKQRTATFVTGETSLKVLLTADAVIYWQCDVQVMRNQLKFMLWLTQSETIDIRVLVGNQKIPGQPFGLFAVYPPTSADAEALGAHVNDIRDIRTIKLLERTFESLWNFEGAVTLSSGLEHYGVSKALALSG